MTLFNKTSLQLQGQRYFCFNLFDSESHVAGQLASGSLGSLGSQGDDLKVWDFLFSFTRTLGL